MSVKTVTVVVPALNEEDNLRAAVEGVIEAAAPLDVELDIVIVNDGSTDRTAEVAYVLERKYSTVRAVHKPQNEGMGAAFRSCVETTKCEWITIITGDNNLSMRSARDMLRNIERADLVCAFLANEERRPLLRRILSSIYSWVYTRTFNVPLRYINGTPLCRVSLLRSTGLRSRGYSWPPEVSIKLLRQGCTFIELPVFMNPNTTKSSALKLRNLKEVVRAYFELIYEIYVGRRGQYSRRPVRVHPLKPITDGALSTTAYKVTDHTSAKRALEDMANP